MLVTALFALLSAPAPIEVPFRMGEDALIVDAKVNGRPVSLMFDTGFGGAVVLDNTLDVGRPTGTTSLRDFVGELSAPTVKVRSLSLGDMKLDPTGLDIVLQSTKGYSEGYGRHVDGILGLEVIRNTITEINFQRNKLIFYPKTLDLNQRKPDNKRTFLVKMLPIGANSIELPVTLANGRMMTMALDTGNSFFATTHRDVLERLKLWDPARKPAFTRLSGVASGAVDSWSFQMPPLKIFGVPVKETVWDIIDLPSSSAEGDGTVGMRFLTNFNVTFDLERRRVWLENWKTPIEEPAPGELGISGLYDAGKKRTIILRVSPGSPADRAGVKVGDALLAIDGADVGDVGYVRLRQMTQGAPGSKVSLATSRSGELRRVDLVREPLVNR